MFNQICIKSKELNSQKIDIAFLIETMLFYGKVFVLVHRNELVTLLKYLGENFLEELIKTGRIELLIRENILGSMKFPIGNEEKYNIDLFSAKDETYSGILYQAHRELYKNSSKNLAFSDKFSKITNPFRYDKNVTSQIRNDFDNEELLKKTLPIYLNSIVPQYEVSPELQIEILKDSSFGPLDAYSLKTNLNLDEINKIHKRNNPNNFHPVDYGGFFLTLAGAKGDIHIASNFESELVTSELYSKFIDVQLTEIIQRRLRSNKNLSLFEEYVLTDCYSIGEAYLKGIVNNIDLLSLLNKADKFREWLEKVPDDKNLIGEYYKAVTEETFAEKLFTKRTRFVIFEGIGITLDVFGTGGIGTAIATGLAAFDEFYLDKLIGGWKPNHFIDNKLKPIIRK